MCIGILKRVNAGKMGGAPMTIDFNVKDSGTRCQEPKYIHAFLCSGGSRISQTNGVGDANPKGKGMFLLVSVCSRGGG